MPDYFVRPYDVLFFRGNKSFHFGEWYTEGIFPPYPSTFQGFVRSKMLFDNGLIDISGKLNNENDAKKLVGDDSELKVDITGPYLMDIDTKTIYFKTPADIFKRSKESELFHSVLTIPPLAKEGKGGFLESDLGFELSCPNLPKEKLDKFCPPDFISLDTFLKYRTETGDFEIGKEDLFMTEDRVGISIDPVELKKQNRGVQKKRFYVTPYNRLKDSTGFYFNVDNVDKEKKLDNGALKLGSESHLTYTQKLGSNGIIEEKLKDSRGKLIEEIKKTKTFKMVLLQPGIFKNGWMPFDYKSDNKVCIVQADGLKLKLLFAFTGAPIKISGYTYAKNIVNDQTKVSLKPIVNAVPAGAVYLFEIIDGCTDENVKTFVEKYDYGKIVYKEYKHYSQMGFNHVILAEG